MSRAQRLGQGFAGHGAAEQQGEHQDAQRPVAGMTRGTREAAGIVSWLPGGSATRRMRRACSGSLYSMRQISDSAS
ncbi:MAG TPA: hypothetical protein VFA28_00040 [Bryobacteraceae bacterium]|nr:hypothetical protein [Bryobacteraceae bacterium]